MSGHGSNGCVFARPRLLWTAWLVVFLSCCDFGPRFLGRVTPDGFARLLVCAANVRSTDGPVKFGGSSASWTALKSWGVSRRLGYDFVPAYDRAEIGSSGGSMRKSAAATHADHLLSISAVKPFSGRRLGGAGSGEMPMELQYLLNISEGWSTFIGIVLTVCGSLMMAAGSIVMKVGLHLEAEKQRKHVNYPCCEPTYLAGFGGYTVGACLHIVALGFAPASVLAPMNSIGLIANAVSAATLLKEPFGTTEAISTAGTVVGVTLCACASLLPQSSKDFLNMGGAAVRNGLMSWTDPWYLAFLAFCIFGGFGALIYVNSVENQVIEEREREMEDLAAPSMAAKSIEMSQQQHHGGAASSPSSSSSAASASAAPSGTHNSISSPPSDSSEVPLMSRSSRSDVVAGPPSFPRSVGMSYGFLAGLVGAQCVLELKELAACIHYGLNEPTIWYRSPQPYLVIIYLLVAVWLQIHFLNLGLARGEATYVVPTYYVMWTFFGTLGGFSKFHEIQRYRNSAIVLFVIGFVITIMCIATLAVQEVTNLLEEKNRKAAREGEGTSKDNKKQKEKK
eukprot:GHVT01052290.1.p1 GENE.GHVT01052290.1~~GHVT01052290.1.p1  ORF type:complete len:565 (+),score=97.96 GHVT01052290.1:951-2645(+)